MNEKQRIVIIGGGLRGVNLGLPANKKENRFHYFGSIFQTWRKDTDRHRNLTDSFGIGRNLVLRHAFESSVFNK